MKHTRILIILSLLFLAVSCTKLDENLHSELEKNSQNISADELLTNAYNQLGQTYQVGNFWHLQEHTSDELIGPTRGPDWDDNGQWRALHAHTWNADNGIVVSAFSDLLSSQFAASNVLEFSPSAQQAAEARFVRAVSMFSVLDGWGKVPYRDDLSDYRILPTTLEGENAVNFIASELTSIIKDLPDNGPDKAYQASKNAARALLMKLYLNKGAFLNRANPSFKPSDLDSVILLADQIKASNKYQIVANKYFDNFAPTNDKISKENIFTFFNENGKRGGNVRGAWFQIAHYNMYPSGWNGFATLSDFYDKFDATDERRGIAYDYPGNLPNPGHRVNVGFLEGQQYDLKQDTALKDRSGVPLKFTPEVHLRETGSDLERTGIRAMKYPFDYATNADQNNNDWVLLRYADVMLMKAEALLRKGTELDARNIVNELRNARGVGNLTTLTLDNLLDERGREFYWEGWRREDLIRFNKYLDTWQEKSSDDARNLAFPIPNSQLAVNPNLTQNDGY